MSSNIRITRICQQCGNEFEARKTTSKTCSDACAKKAYKARQRSGKIQVSDDQTLLVKTWPIETIKVQEFLTVDESAKLIRISRRSLYRLNERGELPFVKLNRRTVIRRADIDRLFEQPAELMEKSRPIPIPLADCYTMKEIREKYSISEKALYELIHRHKVPKQHRGIYAYVPKSQIDQLLAHTLL
ncbi:helix-turn-helix domain-containing protein [Spirosoma flavus]